MLLSQSGGATLPEPDHLVYGTPTRNGEPLAEGLVTAVLDGAPEPIATFEIGSNQLILGHYVLRIPIDSVDPRLPGKAREGEPLQLFVDGVLAGVTNVGERGSVQFLNIDEAGGLLPTIAVADLSAYEGHAGNVIFSLTVSLSEAADEDVTFNWGTVAGTAQPGIDYIQVAPTTVGTVPAGRSFDHAPGDGQGRRLPGVQRHLLRQPHQSERQCGHHRRAGRRDDSRRRHTAGDHDRRRRRDRR